jgi:hypothetical protein
MRISCVEDFGMNPAAPRSMILRMSCGFSSPESTTMTAFSKVSEIFFSDSSPSLSLRW